MLEHALKKTIRRWITKVILIVSLIVVALLVIILIVDYNSNAKKYLETYASLTTTEVSKIQSKADYPVPIEVINNKKVVNKDTGETLDIRFPQMTFGSVDYGGDNTRVGESAYVADADCEKFISALESAGKFNTQRKKDVFRAVYSCFYDEYGANACIGIFANALHEAIPGGIEKQFFAKSNRYIDGVFITSVDSLTWKTRKSNTPKADGTLESYFTGYYKDKQGAYIRNNSTGEVLELGAYLEESDGSYFDYGVKTLAHVRNWLKFLKWKEDLGSATNVNGDRIANMDLGGVGVFQMTSHSALKSQLQILEAYMVNNGFTELSLAAMAEMDVAYMYTLVTSGDWSYRMKNVTKTISEYVIDDYKLGSAIYWADCWCQYVEIPGGYFKEGGARITKKDLSLTWSVDEYESSYASAFKGGTANYTRATTAKVIEDVFVEAGLINVY